METIEVLKTRYLHQTITTRGIGQYSKPFDVARIYPHEREPSKAVFENEQGEKLLISPETEILISEQ